MRPWETRRSDLVFSHPILRLERREVARGEDRREVLVVDTPDWVNVIPLRADGSVLMIRQWRFGIAAPTLEIPGGMVDPGESAETAAGRELLEETGHRAGRLVRLGETHPNPAIQPTRLTSWLATDLVREVAADRLVHGIEGEEITVEAVPLAEIPARIAGGEISHALVVAAFYLHALGATRARR